jgi:hypothetical protein
VNFPDIDFISQGFLKHSFIIFYTPGYTIKKNESSGEELTEFSLRRKVRSQNSTPMGFKPWLLGVPLRAQPLGYSPVIQMVYYDRGHCITP